MNTQSARKVDFIIFVLLLYPKVNIFKRTSQKNTFDLNKTRIFYEYLKSRKIDAIFAH